MISPDCMALYTLFIALYELLLLGDKARKIATWEKMILSSGMAILEAACMAVFASKSAFEFARPMSSLANIIMRLAM